MVYVRLLLSELAQDQEFIRRLQVELPTIVASAMSTSGQALVAHDITIDGDIMRKETGMRLQPPQVLSSDVMILVFGSSYPDLVVAKRDEIARRILRQVRFFMPSELDAQARVYLAKVGSASLADLRE
jgi:hypothetical protein